MFSMTGEYRRQHDFPIFLSAERHGIPRGNVACDPPGDHESRKMESSISLVSANISVQSLSWSIRALNSMNLQMGLNVPFGTLYGVMSDAGKNEGNIASVRGC